MADAITEGTLRQLEESHLRPEFRSSPSSIAHAHAHVIPMLEKTDITSARYIVSPHELQWASHRLDVGRDTLLEVRRTLGMEA